MSKAHAVNPVVIQTPFLLDRLAVSMIRFYQRHISPWKGFRCAHRALHGGDSCSEAVLKLIRTGGVWGNWGLIHQRFRECGLAARALRILRRSKVKPMPAIASSVAIEAEGSNEQGDSGAASSSGNDLPLLCCVPLEFGALGCDVIGSCGEAGCLSF